MRYVRTSMYVNPMNLCRRCLLPLWGWINDSGWRQLQLVQRRRAEMLPAAAACIFSFITIRKKFQTSRKLLVYQKEKCWIFGIFSRDEAAVRWRPRKRVRSSAMGPFVTSQRALPRARFQQCVAIKADSVENFSFGKSSVTCLLTHWLCRTTWSL